MATPALPTSSTRTNARCLEHLDVSHNEIGSLGDSGVQALVESEYLVDLKSLNQAAVATSSAGSRPRPWPTGRGSSNWNPIDLTGCDMSEFALEILRTSPHADKFLTDEATYSV